jgi:Mrp family chromosome partitioning ATPase/capsular polysaccharide biosynthesis protein
VETVRLFRVLRRRWKLIFVITLVGTLLGALAAVRVSDDENAPVVVQVYYDVRHTLIVNDEGQFGVNLEQAAFFTTIGEIPDTVAAELGGDADELAATVQTITNPGLQTLVVSAVAETEDQATTVTNAFAGALIAYLSAEELDAYNSQLANAEEEAATLSTEVEQLDDEIDRLEDRIATLDRQIEGEDPDGDGAVEEPENPDDLIDQRNDLAAELDLLEFERNSVLARLQAAVETRDQLVQQGEPRAPLVTLDVSDPQRVSQREYEQRIEAGTEGTANYRAGESVPSGGGGGGISSSVLDNPLALLLGGVFGGLFVGTVLALILARLDHRILDKEDAEHYFGLPVIAEIPKLRRPHRRLPVIVSRDEPMSHIAEAYRALLSSLIYARDFGDGAQAATSGEHDDAAHEGTVVLVTSPGASEGKTSTVANLSNVLAEQDYSVMALNCDFRRPRLAYFLEGDHEPRRLSKTSIDGVRMINHVTAAGSEEHPTEAIRAQKRVIAEARARFDVVLLDTAPVLATNDANEVIPSADLVLIVAQVGRTTKEGAEATRELLERRRAPVAGVVLMGSDVSASTPGYYYYYSDRKGSRLRFIRARSRARRDARYFERRRRDGGEKNKRDKKSRRGKKKMDAKSKPDTGVDVVDHDAEVKVGR